MSKLIHGVAFNSRGKYKTSNEHKIVYRAWRNMLERCYSKHIHDKHPTYIGCAVSDEWLDYQDFAEWFESNEYAKKAYQLDKDLLFPNNKVYSPQTCCFVPSELNSLLLDSAAARNDNPQGVSFNKPMNKYFASIKINNMKTHLGYFYRSQDAYQVYKAAKEAHVKEKALEWKDRIADNVFQALMNWQLNPE